MENVTQKAFVLGIDPGASGAAAFFWFSGLVGRSPSFETCEVLRFSKSTEPEIAAFVRRADLTARAAGSRLIAAQEIVSGGAWRGRGDVAKCPACNKPKDSGTISPAATFRYGEAYGVLRGIFLGLDVDLRLMSPQKWQKTVEAQLAGCESREDRKRELRAEAQRMFSRPFVLEEADAALIALAAYRESLRG